MIKLTKSTADRAGEIICAHFVLQMRRALQDDQEATYVDLDDLRAYAEECATGYRNRLAACRDLADHEILHRAVTQALDVMSDDYARAFKPKKKEKRK